MQQDLKLLTRVTVLSRKCGACWSMVMSYHVRATLLTMEKPAGVDSVGCLQYVMLQYVALAASDSAKKPTCKRPCC